MMRSVLAMVLIGLVALAGPKLAAAAIELPYEGYEPSCAKAKDGKTYCNVELTLSGTIDEAMSAELRRKLQQVPGTISHLDVGLNSPGGMVGPAMEIGRLLRSRAALVHINAAEGHSCVSACVLIYAGGVVRGAQPKRIGIHRPYLEVGTHARTMAEIKAVMDQMLAQIRAYLVEMNVDPRLADDMMRIPPEQVRYLTYEDRDAYGLGVDPVWQEEMDLAEARRLGITRQEYMRRDELATRLCQGVELDVRRRCKEHYMGGNTSRYVPPVPRLRTECEGKYGIFADLVPGCITGRNVAGVGYQGGKFGMTGKGRWLEGDTNGVRFSYIEERRDDIGVYLVDNSRGVRIYLDINQKKIFYSDNKSPTLHLLYPITDVAIDKYYP